MLLIAGWSARKVGQVIDGLCRQEREDVPSAMLPLAVMITRAAYGTATTK
ncbi:hypothetical protein [Xanthomonas oryzae]|nr:hypothetical protein [Xanthomonas oryzae]